MMLLFLQFIGQELGLKIPAVFFYASTRMILAAITTLLFTIFLGPRFIKKLYELKVGQHIRVEDCPMLGELHKKKKDTPTMGGILILSSMLFALLIWMDLSSSYTWVLAITTLWLGAIGGVDDYLKLKYKNTKGLSGRRKMLLQTIFSLVLSLYLLVPSVTNSLSSQDVLTPPVAKEYTQEGKTIKTHSFSTKEMMARYYFPFFKEPIFVLSGLGLVAGFIITWLTVTGASNAVNLTDGLDGLASGCLIMAAFVLGIVAFLSNHADIARYLHILYIEGSGEIAIYLFALAGACLGFLWYNGYPAQVFMGDIGSLALGGILGVSSVLLRKELLFALVGGVFVAEACSVILQVGSYKLRNRKRIFLIAPLHHHFEYKGWPETKVVMRFWIIAVILAMLGLASLKFQ